jgi:hypothetical protein
MHSREALPPRGEGSGGGFPLPVPLRVSVSLPQPVNHTGAARYTGALYALRSLRSTLTGSNDAS